MSSKDNLQKVFVLHTRAYSETSLLVELLTQTSGRFCVIAKGARRPKSSFKGLLQPFISLTASWCGRGDLPVLCAAESNGVPFRLSAKSLLCCFYINELLMRVLHRNAPCESIFNIYDETLRAFGKGFSEQILLRRFEKALLKELGYALQLKHEANSNEPIRQDQYYCFSSNHGCVLMNSTFGEQNGQNVFIGKNLLAISQDDYNSVEILQDAKRLMRLALMPLIGDKPLKTRDLL